MVELGTMSIHFNVIVICTVAWESPQWMCVCVEVQEGTRTKGRGNLLLLLQTRRKEPHEKEALETVLTWVSNTEGIP